MMEVFYIGFAGISIITLVYFGLLLIRIGKIHHLYPFIVGKRIIWANRIMLIFALCSLIFFVFFLWK